MNETHLLTDAQIVRRKIVMICLIGAGILGMSHLGLTDYLLTLLCAVLGEGAISYYFMILLPYLFLLAGLWIGRSIVHRAEIKVFFKRAIIAYALLMVYVLVFDMFGSYFFDYNLDSAIGYYMMNDTFIHLGTFSACCYLFRSVIVLGNQLTGPHIQRGIQLLQDAMVIMILTIAPVFLQVNTILHCDIRGQEILIKLAFILFAVMTANGFAKLCDLKVAESRTETVEPDRSGRSFSAPVCGMLIAWILLYGFILCPYIL